MFNRRLGRVASAAIGAGVGVVLLTGLSACGSSSSSSPTATTSGDTASASSSVSESQAPSGHTGKALPSDWPSDILVPNGNITLVMQMGTGYSVTVEGVDEAQAKDILTQMKNAGLTVTGPNDTGNGEWTGTASNGTYTATYAYAGGGAGEPNVIIQLTKKP